MDFHADPIKLTQTARKVLELGPPCKPAPRHPDAATSIVICAASAPRGYVTGDGDVKERPILFQGGMVRALLNGSKIQTRRIIKGLAENMWVEESTNDGFNVCYNGPPCCGTGVWEVPEHSYPIACPYGKPGDRLWVREAIRLVPYQPADDGTGPVLSTYEADGSLTVADAWPWKRSYLPPMHCPRGLSRITLEIVSVRVERLQDISEADAARYQWLRGHWFFFGTMQNIRSPLGAALHSINQAGDVETLDVAIDAARAAIQREQT